MNKTGFHSPIVAELFKRFPGARKWLLKPAFISLIFLAAGLAVGNRIHPARLMTVYHCGFAWAIIFLTAGALFSGRMRIRCALFFVCGILLMMHAQISQARVYDRFTVNGTDRRELFACATVASVPMKQTAGWRCILRCDSLYDAQGNTLLRHRSILCISPDSIKPGNRLLLRGTFRPPRHPTVPGAFDEYTYMLSSGLWGTMLVRSQTDLDYPRTLFTRTTLYMRSKVYALLSGINDEGRRALLQAAFLGDKTAIPRELSELFRNAGISHLLAISGQNVVIMTAAILLLLHFVPINRRMKILITIAGLWWFLFKIGTIPSLSRAVIMATVVLGTWVVQRKNHPLNSLGVAGIVWLYFSPQSLITPGFQLSFAATFAIIAVYGPLSRRLRLNTPFLKWVVRPFAESFLLSVAVFAVTLPVILYHFNTLSLAGIAVNIVAVILMSISMWTILAGISVQIALPFLAGYCAIVADWPLQALIGVARIAVQIPFAVINTAQPYPEMILAYTVAGAGVIFVSQQHRMRFVSLALPVLLLLVPLSLLAHRMFDAPQSVTFEMKTGTCTGTTVKGATTLILDVPDSLPAMVYDRQIAPWMRQAHATGAPVLVVRCLTRRNASPVTALARRIGASVITQGTHSKIR